MGKIVNRVKQIRLAHQVKLSRSVPVREVSEAIGVTRAYLSNIEANKAWINEKAMVGLCAFYAVQPGDLLVFIPNTPVTPDDAPADESVT